MTRSSVLGGLLPVLCACSGANGYAASQQLASLEAAAKHHRTNSVAPADVFTGATPAPPVEHNGETFAGVGEVRGAAQLRKSFERCIAQSGGVTARMQDCMAIEAAHQENGLVTAYEALQAMLPPAGRQELETTQSAWLAERRKSCSWNAAEEGQGHMLEAAGCALEMTATRVAQLETRLQGH